MTEEVLVSIKGMQVLEDSGDEVEVVTNGKYRCMGGRHYIRYEEVAEGLEGKIENLIKIDENGMEVTKRGMTNVHMIFEKDKKNETFYETPFGSLRIGIAATSIDVKNDEEKIDVKVSYVLDINSEHMADCTIDMNIFSKNHAQFHLQS